MELVGKRLLIVDDEPLFLQTTCQLLQKEGAECRTAVDAPSALAQLELHQFDLILTDLNMPGNLRWELLQTGRQRWAHVPMIVITGVPSLPSAIESLRQGVTDYLLKPVAFPELLASITRTLSSISQSNNGDAPTVAAGESPEPMIGDSPAMQEIHSMIGRIADANAHVLISGETGTGKELIARVIHQHSRQSSGNFLVVDCNTVVESKLAEELFGKMDEDGQLHPGLLERANGGSLFLDEVAELPLSLQPKLLRVVQNQEFTPIGGSTPQRINVRFISSTQRRMEDETGAGRFRSDLYYRLGVLSLTLPPLRDRGDDALLLARHFIAQSDRPELTLSSAAEQALLAYRWPGNIRELRNCIVRAATFAASDIIDVGDLPVEMTRESVITGSSESLAPIGGFDLAEVTDSTLHNKRLELERVYLLKLLEDSRGNVTHAAQKANLSRQGFHKLLKRHQISAADYR